MKHTFGKIVICHTNDFPAKKNDKIEDWVKNRGGKVVRELTNDVTHYVVSKRVWREHWQNDHPVRTARRKGTIYVVKFDWLEDSLMSVHGRPLDESNTKYAWEVPHAKRVKEKRRKQKRMKNSRKKKEEETLSIADARPSQSDYDDNDNSSNQDPTKDKTTTLGGLLELNESATGNNKRIQRMKDILECGITFDKSCLRFEKDMALAGYRPYTDANNFTYLIMLVRNDIFTSIEESYQLKPSTREHSCPRARNRHDNHSNASFGSRDSKYTDPTPSRSRFEVNKSTTILHYLEDEQCCRSFERPYWDPEIDTINDGHCTPKPSNDHGFRAAKSMPVQTYSNVEFARYQINPILDYWPQHLPFSAYPVLPYESNNKPESFPNSYSLRRVSLPNPFAYSLQLYESYVPTTSSRAMITPNTSPSTMKSFTTSSQSSAQQLTPHSSTASQTSFYSQPPPPTTKTYAVTALFTKKGHIQAEPITLAPRGSTWEFAIDAFKKMFVKKTGIAWEDALSGTRRDSGISMATPSEIAKEDETFASDKFRYIPNTSVSLEKISKQYKHHLGEDWLIPTPQNLSHTGVEETSDEAITTTPSKEKSLNASRAGGVNDQSEYGRVADGAHIEEAGDHDSSEEEHGDKSAQHAEGLEGADGGRDGEHESK